MLNTKKPILGFDGEYRFLSNFTLCPVVYMGNSFVSVEHAYQAAKTDRTLTPTEVEYINSMTSGRVKRWGKTARLRSDWEDIKQRVMFDLIRQKFAQEPFRTLLMNTDGSYIEETNTWGDTYWGVCKGVGWNHLGILLMEVRDELISNQ